MAPRDRDKRLGDLEKRGGWQKPTAQPSAQARPAGLPPKPGGNQGAGESRPGHGGGGQPEAQDAGQGQDERE
jgi:hypothetical protein